MSRPSPDPCRGLEFDRANTATLLWGSSHTSRCKYSAVVPVVEPLVLASRCKYSAVVPVVEPLVLASSSRLLTHLSLLVLQIELYLRGSPLPEILLKVVIQTLFTSVFGAFSTLIFLSTGSVSTVLGSLCPVRCTAEISLYASKYSRSLFASVRSIVEGINCMRSIILRFFCQVVLYLRLCLKVIKAGFRRACKRARWAGPLVGGCRP